MLWDSSHALPPLQVTRSGGMKSARCSASRASDASSRRSCHPRQPGQLAPTNHTVSIDMGQKQWNTKELARLDLRRAGVACGQSDGLQIPFRPRTGGNTFGIPYPYQWVYTHPSRTEDRQVVLSQWPGKIRLDESSSISFAGIGDTNAMNIRLVNRNPWMQVDQRAVIKPHEVSNTVFGSMEACQSLEEYAAEKRRSAVLVKDSLTPRSEVESRTPRFRMAFKVTQYSIYIIQIYSVLLIMSSCRPACMSVCRLFFQSVLVS